MLREPQWQTKWAETRRPLEEAKLHFVNVCRARFVLGAQSLERLSGRPGDGDPIWDGEPAIDLASHEATTAP